ncbi:hypothetical protein VN97_g69 [Penicillium thymicola]|uniref:Uncharacterized protein n=1 Tax=Penicillium thymicola TaxID=293382 RepID=A0AAI9XDN0_PENTH|nr:hypothetical protein VN97_g69 [Penicillium thymicola]
MGKKRRREEEKKRITGEDTKVNKRKVYVLLQEEGTQEKKVQTTDSLASYLGRHEVLEPSAWKERGQLHPRT